MVYGTLYGDGWAPGTAKGIALALSSFAVIAENLRKRYGDTQVVHGIDCTSGGVRQEPMQQRKNDSRCVIR